MDIQRFGHATLLATVDDQRVLIDPGTYATDAAFSLTDLTAIVITHQHADHADPARLPGLLAGSPDAQVLVEAGVAATVPAVADRARVIGPGETIELGSAVLTMVGGAHAVIHPDLPSIGNVGVTIRGASGPTLFHPGDAYAAVPDGVDVLAVPLAAPWAKLQETVDFVRAVGPRTVFAIHDAGLSDLGGPVYRRTVESIGGVADVRWLEPTGSLTVD